MEYELELMHTWICYFCGRLRESEDKYEIYY